MPGASTVHPSTVCSKVKLRHSSTTEVMGRRMEALAHCGILLTLKIKM